MPNFLERAIKSNTLKQMGWSFDRKNPALADLDWTTAAVEFVNQVPHDDTLSAAIRLYKKATTGKLLKSESLNTYPDDVVRLVERLHRFEKEFNKGGKTAANLLPSGGVLKYEDKRFYRAALIILAATAVRYCKQGGKKAAVFGFKLRLFLRAIPRLVGTANQVDLMANLANRCERYDPLNYGVAGDLSSSKFPQARF